MKILTPYSREEMPEVEFLEQIVNVADYMLSVIKPSSGSRRIFHILWQT